MAHDHQHDHGDGANTRRLAMTLARVLIYMGVEVIDRDPSCDGTHHPSTA